MMALRKLFWLNKVKPVTHNDVPPAAREPGKEKEIKAATTQLVQEVMAVERRSWEIRQELAGNVLEIVAGAHQ